MKNRILVVPDIHGEDFWVNQRPETFDKIVFLGDFWDSFHKTIGEQTKMFHKVMKWKEMYPDKVHILIGNHDYQYLMNRHMYAGWQANNALAIHDLMIKHKDKFQNAVIIDSILFTHAGLSNTFFDRISTHFDESQMNEDWYLNEFGVESEQLHAHLYSDYGDDMREGISFIRPKALSRDLYLSERVIFQVVGHTHSDSFKLYDSLVVADCYKCLIFER